MSQIAYPTTSSPDATLQGRLGRVASRAGNSRLGVLVVLLAMMLAASGCASNKICLRSVPQSPLIEKFDLTSYSGPKASQRTVQLLRVCNLTDNFGMDARPLLARLQAINDREPSADKVYALSELAFLGGKEAEPIDQRAALDLYGASVLHAYSYLFDERFAATRNAYDPQYRGACDLYNGALESALRIICANRELIPNTKKVIHTTAGDWEISCQLRGTLWQPQDIERFEFVSDYEMKGLKNLYLTHGLGVPLIAVRRAHADAPAVAKYYPPKLSFPVTAFLRPQPRINAATGHVVALRNQGVLELYDPLATEDVAVAGRRVPLESDLTTPLAYFLARPELDSLATLGLLLPERLLKVPSDLLKTLPGQARPIVGLYMAQPYEPGKIPVLLVHGLWSSPMTWMEMFNDLRSLPDIRDHYQFWFYLYPTGQPFWLSAADLRRDLVQVREVVDPQQQEPALDQMVLIGHSMGGLVSRMQTINSGADFWKLVSDKPISQIKAEPDVLQQLQDTFFFQPNPSIRRVVTIGTPHHGSALSRQTTQWLLEKMINFPQMLLDSQKKLYRDNPDAFADTSLLKVKTSIDSLSPHATIFPAMLGGQRPPWVKYHNIIGVLPKQWWISKLVSEGDGVVSRDSAHVDDAVSEITVPADHTTVHAHPGAVLEVRRILLEHLADLQGAPVPTVAHRTTPLQAVQVR